MSLKGKTIVVTGATGSIGCRVVEKLVFEHGAKVRCYLRSYAKAARIARLPIEMHLGEIADTAALDKAIEGAEAVIHCAYDWMLAKNNVEGSRAIAEACIRHDVRMVQISTMAIYEPLPRSGDVTEETPVKPNGRSYHDTKIEIEKVILDLVKSKGLRASILQPTVVYGPFGGVWTDEPVQKLLTGTVVLPDQGEGLCSAVYIDDVAEAMILAAASDKAVGERLLISGPEPVSWKDFYEGFAKALNLGPIQYISSEEIRRKNKNLVANLKLIMDEPKRLARWTPLRKMLMAVYSRLGPGLKKKAASAYKYRRAGAPKEVFLPNEQQIALFTTQAVLQCDKAKQVLGYDPQFDFKSGMELTAEYIRWAYSQQAATAA